MKTYSLSKQERLKSRKEIGELLLKGKSTFGFPFKAVYSVYRDDKLVETEGCAVRIMVSVPKRNFKRAVMRNLLKRRIREAYRTNKQLVTLEVGSHLNILFVYVAKTELPYRAIEKAICGILHKIKGEVNEEN